MKRNLTSLPLPSSHHSWVWEAGLPTPPYLGLRHGELAPALGLSFDLAGDFNSTLGLFPPFNPVPLLMIKPPLLSTAQRSLHFLEEIQSLHFLEEIQCA